MARKRFELLLASATCLVPGAVHAQTAIDRVDPTQIERNALPAPAKLPDSKPVLETAPVEHRVRTSGTVDVGAIMFSGLSGLEPSDFSDIVARYIGRSLSSDELSRLAEEVSARARGRGFVFASARIEPQRLTTGVLTVRFDPGVLDDIRVEGDDQGGAVRAALLPLIGHPATLDQVERRLLIAGDIDGVSVRRSLFAREQGRGILIVTVARTPLRVRMVVENDSTAPIGPIQMRIDADLSAVLASDDAFTVTYVSTPFEPDELQYIRGRYAKRIDADGTEVSIAATAAATHPGAYLDALDLRGRSWSGTVELRHPLHRRRDASLWLGAELGLRDSRLHRGAILRRHDRILAMRMSLYGNADAAGGKFHGNLTLSRGLDALGATRAGDPDASRGDADGVFTHLVASGRWVRPLGDGFSVRLAGLAQIASGPLLLAEEVGIGGSIFLRGYDYSERSGDQAYMGSAELRYDWRNPFGLGRKAQLYGFVDGGRATNLAGGFGGGGLASGGGGVRADVSASIDANVEVAVPLSGPRYETGASDPRLNLRLLKVF